MVNRALVASNAPLQLGAVQRSCDGKTIIDAALNLGGFLVVVPGDELKVFQLVGAAVVPAGLGHGNQPGLSAELLNFATVPPQGQRIVKAFEARTESFKRGIFQGSSVKTIEVGQAHVAGSDRGLRGKPGKSAVGLRFGKGS